ncbi:hypothetical protein C8N35_102145 [Breoghania corrubedonensis]|uniref:Uncharacterized protein n=1 Tax=Breoghania corrubedonensis TaxID=665038 RepID=A0A2T5VCG2_9HYPH|nr:hypothetical protein [Breoghania corrubedonensis]PTW61436.1 hypothetical protein C8N35_102145 [Breoghania corrubedonensis]
MSVPLWPSELPRPMRSGYRGGIGDGRQATRPEQGPVRVRRRYSSVAMPLAMTVDVTLDERKRFERFWREDTSEGSLPWLMPDPESDGHPILTTDGAPLLTADGAPLLLSHWWLVMFDTQSAPSWSPRGIRWQVQMTLMIMP